MLGDTYVVAGPAFTGERLQRLNGRVLVPSHVWKAIYVPAQGAGAWIATNEPNARWEVVSVATLTTRTGIDPFPKLVAQPRPRFRRSPISTDRLHT